MLVTLAVTFGLATTANAIPKRETLQLSREDSCYRYTGDATDFVGRLPAGSYVGVTMQTLDAFGLPKPPGEEMRIPVMDAPEYRTGHPAFWFGPLPATRTYGITFMPRAEFGRKAIVTICVTPDMKKAG